MTRHEQTSPSGPDRRTFLRAGLFGAGLLGAAGLTGCAGSLTRPAAGDVLTFANTNPTWDPGFLKVGAVLRRKCGYYFQTRPVGNADNFQQIVRMSARTNTSPDLVKWWTGYRLVDIARDGLLADLSPAWDLAESKGWIDDPDLKETFTYDGKQYGMPLYKTYYVAFYSKKAFAEIGAEPPETWDELMSLCEKFRKKGITPIAAGGAGGAGAWESCIWFGQLVNGTDHDYYRKVTTDQASYTDEPARRAMDTWAQLYTKGYMSAPDFVSTNAPGLIKQGAIGMHLYGTWNTGSYITAGLTDKDFGMFVMPSLPGGSPSVVVESSPLSVSSEAHKKEAAQKLCASWLDPDVQSTWVGFLNDLSANPNVNPPAKAPQEIAATIARTKPSQAVRYWEASPPVLIEGNIQDLSAYMANPTVKAGRSTLDKLQRRSDLEWKAWKA